VTLATTSLAPGESTEGTITHIVLESDAPSVTNTATATGTDPLGGTVNDTDPCRINVAIGPDIEVIKTASLTGTCPGTDPLNACIGDTVTYCFNVTNTGDVTLTNVTVVDDIYGHVTLATNTLAPGDSTLGTLTHVATVADIPSVTNIATVSATDPLGGIVTDDDDCTVNTEINPGIRVTKTASPPGGPPGTDITFTITVTNAGDCLLDPVMVVDTLPGEMSYVSSSPAADSHDGTITWNNVGPLDVGASKTIKLVARIDEGAAGMLENLACATGTPPVGADVHDCDTAVIEVLAKTIEPPEKTLFDITTEIKSDGIVIEGEQFGWETGNGNLLNNPPLIPGEAVGGIKYDEKMISLNGTTKFEKRFGVNTNVTPNIEVSKSIGYKSGDLGSLSYAEQVGMRYYGASPPLSSTTTCEEVNAYSKMVVTDVDATTETEVGIIETDERDLLYEIDAEGKGSVSAGVDTFVEGGGDVDTPASRMMYEDKSDAYGGNFTFRKEIGYTSNPP
jgi:uncharacterized repeat protein (TIGR01451 family)